MMPVKTKLKVIMFVVKPAAAAAKVKNKTESDGGCS